MTNENEGEHEARQRFIVGEVTITYDRTEDADAALLRTEMPLGTIGKRFEHVVEVNAQRGYRLMNWHMTSTPIVQQVGVLMPTVAITETIVAVFEDERGAQTRGGGSA